jgi:ubiquinol-cytochrome c reductase cytochrome b subunit
VLHGRESGRIIRLPHGEYVEVHEPVDAYTQYKLVDFKDYKPTLARPNASGKITAGARIRASLSKFYFEDRIAPVTQGELDAAHHDHHEAVEAAPAAEAPKAVTAKKAPVAKKAPAAKKPAAKAAPAAKKPAAKKAPKKD